MIPTFVYTESTPNPKTMKFVADRVIVDRAYEYKEPEEVSGVALLERLFNFPFVDSIYIYQNFISVTKNDLVEWDDISAELREYIQDYLKNNLWVIEPDKNEQITPNQVNSTPNHNSTKEFNPEELSEIEQQIHAILEEYVTPAVEQDGGAILFQSFDPKTGRLTVEMKGACNGCPSSTATLKNGIENLFKDMLPAVQEVVSAE